MRVQEELTSVISLLTHKPPLTPPANTRLCVASLGSNKIARVLPPILLGPRSTQELSEASPGALCDMFLFFNCSCKANNFSGVGRPKAGFISNKYSRSIYLLGGKPRFKRSFLLSFNLLLIGLFFKK